MNAGWYRWSYVPSGEPGGGNDLPGVHRWRERDPGQPGSGNDLPGRGHGHMPWITHAVSFLVSAVTSKEAASTMTNKEAAQQIVAAADKAISKFVMDDDWWPPWQWPGPPPWLSILASDLTFVANTLQEGSLRTGILRIAGQVLDQAQVGAPAKVVAASKQ